MGRQNSNDPALVGPSIALLQERFKKLERIKEKREEERQLMFSEPRRSIPTNYRSYNSSSDEPLFLPSRPAFDRDPPSLGLNLSNKHADYGALKKTQPSFSSSWSADQRCAKTPQMVEFPDHVDTSLHL